MFQHNKILRSKATLKSILYLLTITKHKKTDYVLPQDIYPVLSILRLDLPTLVIIDQSFERSGHYTQLHYHAIVSITDYFKFKSYTSIKGFQLSWACINNLYGAQRYIFKDTKNKEHIQDEIIALNTYTHKKAPHLFI